jgi:hypothetical protein
VPIATEEDSEDDEEAAENENFALWSDIEDEGDDEDRVSIDSSDEL